MQESSQENKSSNSIIVSRKEEEQPFIKIYLNNEPPIEYQYQLQQQLFRFMIPSINKNLKERTLEIQQLIIFFLNKRPQSHQFLDQVIQKQVLSEQVYSCSYRNQSYLHLNSENILIWNHIYRYLKRFEGHYLIIMFNYHCFLTSFFYSIPKSLLNIQMTQLRKIHIRQFQLESLQFLTYLYTPQLQIFQIYDSNAASIKPLNKLKYDNLRRFFIQHMLAIPSRKLQRIYLRQQQKIIVKYYYTFRIFDVAYIQIGYQQQINKDNQIRQFVYPIEIVLLKSVERQSKIVCQFLPEYQSKFKVMAQSSLTIKNKRFDSI